MKSALAIEDRAGIPPKGQNAAVAAEDVDLSPKTPRNAEEGTSQLSRKMLLSSWLRVHGCLQAPFSLNLEP